jgi:iron complex transport system substrate-binding protein
VVWIVADDAGVATVRDLPLRPTMRAFTEGREIVADTLLSAAFSHGSPLSMEYVIEELVPELVLALDGDPATVVPSSDLIAPGGGGGTTTTAAATATSGAAALDADQQAAADAWAAVFDSAVGFDAKAPHLEDADALADTVAAYETAGAGMGGISLTPSGVARARGTATVTNDVLFGGTAAYEDLTGTLSLVDGTCMVRRTEFCSFMASARTPCR